MSGARQRLAGKVCVVTGAARGIGRAVARAFVAEGAVVHALDRLAGEVQAVAGEIGATAWATDITDADAVATTFAAIGPVDVLVNNAGITGGNMPSWEIPVAQWRRVVDVNLNAPFIVASAVVPHLIANGWGRIVNVASVAGKEGNPNAAHYSASKAGLIGYTKSLAKELAQKGVLVNCVTPAAAKTDIFHQMTDAHIAFMLSKIPMGRFVEVEEIAAMICWLSSADCSFSTGAVFDISGGRATY